MTSIRHWAACAALAAALGPAQAYTDLYVLGDSLSDAGNIALAVGSDPAQVITGNGYIPDLPYASGQFSNDKVWTWAFAASLGFASAARPSIAGGHDFAFGGARMALDGPGLAPSVKAQAGVLLGSVGALPAGALYVVEGGGNDARDILEAAALSPDPFGVIGTAAAAYAQATGDIVDRLQAAGAHHIVVWNVPNLGATPAVAAQGGGAALLGGQVSMAMNGALADRLAAEAGVSLFDTFGVLGAVVADPASHGLLNVTDACGAIARCDPSTYLFWDGIHPTSAGHAILAEQLLASAVPEPEAGLLMACGLLVLARRRLAGRALAPKAA